MRYARSAFVNLCDFDAIILDSFDRICSIILFYTTDTGTVPFVREMLIRYCLRDGIVINSSIIQKTTLCTNNRLDFVWR